MLSMFYVMKNAWRMQVYATVTGSKSFLSAYSEPSPESYKVLTATV